MRRALSTVLAALLVISVPPACGPLLGLDGLTDRVDDGGSPNDGPAGDVAPNPDAVGATTASKVDVLFVVDDSASMGDKSTLLSKSVGGFLKKITATVSDVHVGVITTSLGSMGGDVCANGSNQNRLAHLSTMSAGGTQVAGTDKGFLEYGGTGESDINVVVAGAELLVGGVGESGCGLEAQLESTYRFLVQPDPWTSIVVKAGVAQYDGIDTDVIRQRKAFLRPDSLLVVVLLTDEDDSSVDPRSLDGEGWAFENLAFPGSKVFRADGKTTTAPRGTSACSAAPASPDCVSCGCASMAPACIKAKTDPECLKDGGYYGTAEDQLNVRFFHMKQRFGADPQFPLARYIDGFTKSKVPDRDGEHAVIGSTVGNTVSEYLGKPSCTNPLFAAKLPDPGGDLCNLPKGVRGKELVVFAVIGGVPDKLTRGALDWSKVLGTNPDAFDLAGIDPHMLQSTTPRAGLPPPSTVRGDNGPDPVHGREWTTNDDDLQFACTFQLVPVRTCTVQDPSCDCAGNRAPPLCSATPGEQVRGKAYPTIRELRVVKALGDRGVAGSICPTDPANGYTPTMDLLAARIAPRLVKK